MKYRFKNFLLEIFKKYRTVILYFIIGSSAAVLDLIIYLVLFNLFEMAAVISTIISVFSATIYGFFMNVMFNFKVYDRILFRFLSYASVSGVGIILSASMLYVFYDIIGFDGNIVKIISLPLIFLVQYTLNRYISFKKSVSDVSGEKEEKQLAS